MTRRGLLRGLAGLLALPFVGRAKACCDIIAGPNLPRAFYMGEMVDCTHFTRAVMFIPDGNGGFVQIWTHPLHTGVADESSGNIVLTRDMGEWVVVAADCDP